MNIDIVVPDNNEDLFLPIAEKLGYSRLCFGYILKDVKKGIEKINKLQGKTKIKLDFAVICDSKKTRNITNLCIFDCSFKNNSVIRYIFESKDIDLVFGLENNSLKDHTHFVNSGLDQVLCKIAKKKNKIVCFDFSSILNSSDELRSKLLSRMIQNIKLCKKYKVDIAIISFAKKPDDMKYYHDLIAFLIVLKCDPAKAKKAVKVIINKIKKKKFINSDKYLCEGLTTY